MLQRRQRNAFTWSCDWVGVVETSNVPHKSNAVVRDLCASSARATQFLERHLQKCLARVSQLRRIYYILREQCSCSSAWRSWRVVPQATQRKRDAVVQAPLLEEINGDNGFGV